MRFPLRLNLFALALPLCALPALAADEVHIDPAFSAVSMAPSLLKAQSDGNKTVRGIRRVAIGSFDVEFATRGSSSASATWLNHRNYSVERASDGSYMALAGLKQADFQAIADQVHAAFVRELGAAGLELVPVARVMETDTFRKLAGGGKPAPYLKSGAFESSTVVTAEGRPVTGASLGPAGGSLSAMGNFSSVTSAMLSGPELARELDATVVNVRMVVRFVELPGTSPGLLSRVAGASTAASKVSPTVVAGETTVHLFAPQGGGAFTLQVPLRIDTAAFTGVKDLMSPGSKATGVGLAVLSFAMGKNDSGALTQFEAVADPLRYRELVGAGLGQLASMMAEQIKTLR